MTTVDDQMVIAELKGSEVLGIVLVIPIFLIMIKHCFRATYRDGRGLDAWTAIGVLMPLLLASGWLLNVGGTGPARLLAVLGQILMLAMAMAIDRWAVGKLRC